MDDRTQIGTTPLEVLGAGRRWQATAGRVWTIGRANEADIHLENPRVSRDHAVLEATRAIVFSRELVAEARTRVLVSACRKLSDMIAADY